MGRRRRRAAAWKGRITGEGEREGGGGGVEAGRRRCCETDAAVRPGMAALIVQPQGSYNGQLIL